MSRAMESTIDREAEWHTTIELMQGLFPKWHISNDQLKSWKQKFGMLNPEWFREALHLTYHNYNSDSPKPKWVAEMFKQVKAGHQGLPLNESECASLQLDKEQEEQKRYELKVKLDRANAQKEVSSWTKQEQVYWAEFFINRYKGFASSENKPNDVKTWSPTFTQFVCSVRRIQDSK